MESSESLASFADDLSDEGVQPLSAESTPIAIPMQSHRAIVVCVPRNKNSSQERVCQISSKSPWQFSPVANGKAIAEIQWRP